MSESDNFYKAGFIRNSEYCPEIGSYAAGAAKSRPKYLYIKGFRTVFF